MRRVEGGCWAVRAGADWLRAGAIDRRWAGPLRGAAGRVLAGGLGLLMSLGAMLIYAVTIFWSAAALFVVEPMIAKMLLPALGGTAAVWITCSAFFQVMLVAGYLYAHLTSRLPVRRQALLHVGLLALALLTLPFRPVGGWSPDAGAPVPWLIARLTVAVGLPFLLMSATAPLLQRWFARSSDPRAHDPYFLYAASNLGSLVGLASYPFLLEPLLTLEQQRWSWAGGFTVLLLLFAACGWRSRGARRVPATPETVTPVAVSLAPPPSARTRLHWLVLAAVPASLCLGVTSHVTVDIAPVPLLWVVPLALYLATFVIAFARRPPIPPWLSLRGQPFLLLALAVQALVSPVMSAAVTLPLHLVTFFVTALVCHQFLAARRPATRYLTEYYLWLSVGGALGSLFNVIAAPVLFDGFTEYPLSMVAAALLRPAMGARPGTRAPRIWDIALPLGIVAVLVGGHALVTRQPAAPATVTQLRLALLMLAALAVFASLDRPLRFGLGLGALLLVPVPGGDRVLHAQRSFFGAYRVMHRQAHDQLALIHGDTNHGLQNATRDRGQPLLYFHRASPIARVLDAYAGSPLRRQVAVVGLGIGTLAAYAQPGERWTFYEIDPVIVQLARDERWFSFLRDARGELDVVVGDGRLAMASAPDGGFGIIALDAFSSCAVPVHLLTREAFQLYARKLAPGGVIAVHVANRYLDLAPAVVRAAAAAGLSAMLPTERALPPGLPPGSALSAWVVLAREPSALAPLATRSFQPAAPEASALLWTDDYSHLLAAMRWKSLTANSPPRVAGSAP